MPDYKTMYEEEVEYRERQESVRREYEYDEYLRREESRKQRHEEIRYEINFMADSWKQAFRQNICRLKGELKSELDFAKQVKADPEGYQLSSYTPDGKYWRETIRANQLADEYLDEEMRHIAPIIAKLQAKIAKLERRARERVVKRVEETTGDGAAIEVLVDGYPSDLLQW